MLKGRQFLQVAVLTSFLSLLSLGAPVSPQEESQMLYGTWKLPAEFTLKRIETLLNRFSDETYGKAFRYVGVEEDFFHGHVLFERKLHEGKELLHPRAILYHTQEEAHKAHWEKTVDPKYDYLNVTTRNWIQWLSENPQEDGLRIENARAYLDVAQKDPNQFFDKGAEPKKELHYTIHAKNLDSTKLGFVLAGELQFEFYSDEKGTISLRETPLSLFTNSIYLERGIK